MPGPAVGRVPHRFGRDGLQIFSLPLGATPRSTDLISGASTVATFLGQNFLLQLAQPGIHALQACHARLHDRVVALLRLLERLGQTLVCPFRVNHFARVLKHAILQHGNLVHQIVNPPLACLHIRLPLSQPLLQRSSVLQDLCTLQFPRLVLLQLDLCRAQLVFQVQRHSVQPLHLFLELFVRLFQRQHISHAPSFPDMKTFELRHDPTELLLHAGQLNQRLVPLTVDHGHVPPHIPRPLLQIIQPRGRAELIPLQQQGHLGRRNRRSRLPGAGAGEREAVRQRRRRGQADSTRASGRRRGGHQIILTKRHVPVLRCL
mmetsp:Transcript_13110/g.37847  ORF Transcript_13110/g.37847 Transcript_13110/m.37847 type:complete len:318 (-) Transcript_13110:17-970(-)